jgi:transcriptional regulator with XRE-family HTH domain
MTYSIDSTVTDHLSHLLQAAGLKSLRALSQRSSVSRRQIQKLRQGNIDQIHVEALLKLSAALQITLTQLLDTFLPQSLRIKNDTSHDQVELDALKLEYQRLLTQLDQQQETLRHALQQEALQILEPWLQYWPSAVDASQENPQFLASKLIPLVRPVEKLMAEWNVRSIAAIGSEVAYNPQHHQLIEGQAQPGDSVRVRYAGYFHGDRLLLRAKVSPMAHNDEI